MNKVNTNDTLNRMKSLMSYGLQTESKNAPYSAVEYQKVGADGKVYGIVREGTKYYIKSAPNKQNIIKEDFGYIGGFRNRKDNEYSNFALAQKQFDLKMMSLKEAYNNPTFNVESWDLNKKELVVTEASDKMKGEILRERQIMKNAMMITETKNCGDMPGLECPKDKSAGKDAPFTEDGTIDNQGDTNIKGESKPVVKEEEVLGWNRGNDDYMDKSHGTEIGDSAPFDDATARNIDNQDKKVSKTGEMKNGVVENHGTSMHDTDNQNSPAVGVGEGPSDDNNKPFDAEKGKQIDEAITEIGDNLDDAEGEEPIDGGEGMEGEEPIDGGEGIEGEGEPVDTDALGDDEGLGDDFEDDDLDGDEFEDDEFGDEDPAEEDLENRISAMEDLLSQIASKLGIEQSVDADAYGDDDLFGDEGDEEFGDDLEGGEEDFGAEGEEPEFGGDDLGGEGEPEGSFEDEGEIEDEYQRECGVGAQDPYMGESRRRGGVKIYETAAFKRAMRNQRINEAGSKEWKEHFDKLFGGNPFDAEGCKKLGLDADELYGGKAYAKKQKKAKKAENSSRRISGRLVNEEGMTPFTDNGRVPSGNMNKLDDFGKHPAYQKVVMSLPPKDMKEFPGNYDMNDDSVRNDNPYGEKIGDGAPFDIDPEAIDNAIAEAFDRLRRSKKA